jgi:hypothetical protein
VTSGRASKPEHDPRCWAFRAAVREAAGECLSEEQLAAVFGAGDQYAAAMVERFAREPVPRALRPSLRGAS